MMREPLLQERYDHYPTAKGERDRLEKEPQEFTNRRRRSKRRENGHGKGSQCGRRQATKKSAISKNSDGTRADEQECHFGLQNYGHEKTDHSERVTVSPCCCSVHQWQELAHD